MVSLHKGPGVTGHYLRVGGEAAAHAADDGAGRVQVQVHHRGQVEGDAHLGQALGHDLGLGASGLNIVLFAQNLGRDRGGKAVGLPQPGHPSPLLIDGHEQGQIRGRGLQGRGQGQKLLPAVRVVDQNNAAQVPIPDRLHNWAVVRHPFAPKADHDHLPQLDRQGRIRLRRGRGQGDGGGDGRRRGRGGDPGVVGADKEGIGARGQEQTRGRGSTVEQKSSSRNGTGQGVGHGCRPGMERE